MALFSPAPRSTVSGRGFSPAPQFPVKLGLHLAQPVVHSPGACVVRRVSQAFSLFSFSFLSCRSRSSLSGNCCASEHELLVTVNARGSDPGGTVTGVTWLLSSFSLRAGPSTFLSSSPGSSTTTVRSWGSKRWLLRFPLGEEAERLAFTCGASSRGSVASGAIVLLPRAVGTGADAIGSRRMRDNSCVQRKNHPASRFMGRRRLQAP